MNRGQRRSKANRREAKALGVAVEALADWYEDCPSCGESSAGITLRRVMGLNGWETVVVEDCIACGFPEAPS